MGPKRGVALERDVPEPVAAPGEAIVEPIRMGISRADLAASRGGGGPEPLTLGHEFVGVVRSVEPGTTPSFTGADLVGKRVVGARSAACGRCELCRSGLSLHCRSRTVLGLRGRDGCFADAFSLPARNLTVVPDEVDDDHAVFADPLASAIHAAQQVHLEGKPYVTVLGDGIIGLLCAQVMVRYNASVRLIGGSESRLSLCEKWGVKHRLSSEVGRRTDQDVVIDCTGTREGLSLAMKLVRPRGTIVLKQPPSSLGCSGSLDLSPVFESELTLVGSRVGSLAEAVDTLRRGEVDVLSLIGRRLKLDDGERAIMLAAEADQLRVLMDR